MNPRGLLSEALGTALLVFLAVGTATLTFGFKVTGTSQSAGVVATALAFGLVLLALVYGMPADPAAAGRSGPVPEGVPPCQSTGQR